MAALSSIFQDYDLYINALVASLLISYASAPIGVFLNLKRMTLMGEAISHSLLPGFAVAFMLYGMSYSGLIIGGLIAGVLVLGLMMGLNRLASIKEDGVLTIVYLTFSAFGILIVLKSGIKIDLSHILIGNILLIDRVWLVILFISSILIRIIFSQIKKNLLIVLMDPEYAQFLGIPIQRVKSLFYFLVLWILVLCFYSVGTLLALGLLVIPALLAKVVVKSIDRQIRFGLFFGVLMSLAGLVASVTLDWPTGPTIILSGGLLFLLVVFTRAEAFKFVVLVLAFFFFGSDTHAAFLTGMTPKDQILISNPYLKLYINHLVVAADKVSIDSLVPIDQSLHNYQLKPSDMKKIKHAKVFLYIGNNIEQPLKDQVVRINPEVKAVNLISGLPTEFSKNDHAWLNPDAAIGILEAIKIAIVTEKPDLTERLESRATHARFNILDYTTNIRDKFKPYKGRSLLLSHNSLNFLDNLLGIHTHYYLGTSSPADVMSIKKILKDRKIPIIKEYGSVDFLFESLVKDQDRTFAGEVYGELIPVEMFETKNYLDLLKSNLDAIFDILTKNKIQGAANRRMQFPIHLQLLSSTRHYPKIQ